MKEFAQKFLDQPMHLGPQPALSGFGTAAKTVGNVLKDEKESFYSFAKKVEDQVDGLGRGEG
ncbi:hypothetical protein [Peribacillus loiseleuriae]|uniref:hypothetical protein n=1 Tax=Peribacillus loiseleuriae TaxID=1679170 RepID=UPI003D0696C4